MMIIVTRLRLMMSHRVNRNTISALAIELKEEARKLENSTPLTEKRQQTEIGKCSHRAGYLNCFLKISSVIFFFKSLERFVKYTALLHTFSFFTSMFRRKMKKKTIRPDGRITYDYTKKDGTV